MNSKLVEDVLSDSFSLVMLFRRFDTILVVLLSYCDGAGPIFYRCHALLA